MSQIVSIFHLLNIHPRLSWHSNSVEIFPYLKKTKTFNAVRQNKHFPITPAVWWSVSSVLVTREFQSLLQVKYFSHNWTDGSASVLWEKWFTANLPLLLSKYTTSKCREHSSCSPLQRVNPGPDAAVCVWQSGEMLCVMCVSYLVAWVQTTSWPLHRKSASHCALLTEAH